MSAECGAVFLWDAGNLDPISRHDVTREEVESAFADAHAFVVQTQYRSNELRYEMLGETDSGRVLTVIFMIRAGCIRTVTAFSPQRKSAAAYALRRGDGHGKETS